MRSINHLLNDHVFPTAQQPGVTSTCMISCSWRHRFADSSARCSAVFVTFRQFVRPPPVQKSGFKTSCTSMTLHARLCTRACTQDRQTGKAQHQSWATCVVGHTRGRLTAMACMRKLFSPNSLAGTTYTSWKRGVQTAGAGQPGTTILPRYQAVSGKIRPLSPDRATLRNMAANMHVFTHAHPCIQ